MKNFVSFMALFFSSGFFSGFLPGKITGKLGKGGGLAGSIVALIVQAILICNGASWVQNAWLCVVAIGIGLVTVRPGESLLLKWTGKRKRHTGEFVTSDFNETNIDEIAGQMIAGMAAFIWQTNFWVSLLILSCSFIAFRYFDVKKPLGIKWLENALKKNHSALSIMLDDVLGGIYAMLVGFIIHAIWKLSLG